jgi:hypothetical protein
MVTIALYFAYATPLVLLALFTVALGFAAQRGDEQPQRDWLEEKYAAPACEGRVHTRSGVR